MSAAPRPFAAVLFDLDGVIVDTAELHFSAWKRLAERLSIEFDEKRNEALKGVDRLSSLELLLAAQAPNFSAVEKQDLAELKNRWYVDSLASIGQGHLLPGALDALDQVRLAGVRVALASASRNAALVLARLGIAGAFDVVVDAAKIARGKPAPDLFLAAADSLAVEPMVCLGIEDASAGVAGLKAAGMAALGVGDAEILSDADWVLPSLKGFRLSTYRCAA